MARYKPYLNTSIVIILIFSLLAVSAGPAMAKPDNPPRMDPDFLQLVTDNPGASFKVIVQKDAKYKDLKDKELEKAVRQGGGKVQKHLDLIVSFSAEMTGKEIKKLSKNPKVHWISPDAPVISTGGNKGLLSMLDRFDQISYSGSDGTDNWDSAWQEVGDGYYNDPANGSFLIKESANCESSNCLRINPYSQGAYIYRQMDLSGAATATLSFYRNNKLDANYGYDEAVSVEVSGDNGNSWTTLQTYTSNTYLGEGEDSFDLTSYASAATQVRIVVSQTQWGSRNIFFDNVQIEYAYPSPFRAIIGADALQQNTNLTGQGVTVAVIDSGISNHVDLEDSSRLSRINGAVTFGGHSTPEDEYVHGTHIAGIIAGNGTSSNGKYMGVAPGVNLVNVRVTDDQGMTYTSDVVAGMEWVYNNKDAYNIKVLNLSINSTVPESYHVNPLDAAAEILWFNGITVVVAAGNNGTADGPATVFPPANDPFVITVGALEDEGTTAVGDDFVGAFSAYGITEDGYAKPDLVAPGRNLISLLAGTSATGYIEHPKHRVDNNYFRMSGTSMAAPVVSGTIALLLQDEPNLNPDQIKFRLTATANQNWAGYDAAKAGAGVVNAFEAVNGTSTGTANTGILPSQLLFTGTDDTVYDSVGWNSVGWNSVGWNSVGWNSVGWNSVGWNSVGWNSVGWNSVGWNSVGWND